MRVVFDSNIFISAFIVPGSQGEQALSHARQGRFELYTSVPILTETARKLRGKFDQPAEDITEALKLISHASEVLKPRTKLTVLEDDPDNRILECALDAHADLVVTGDRHLLKLKEFRGIPIIRLADFLRMFPEENR